MNRRSQILAACLLALAAAWVTFHHDAPAVTGPAAGSIPRPPAKPELSARTTAADSRPKAGAVPRESRGDDGRPGETLMRRSSRQGAAAITSSENLSRAALERRAQRVEQEADHELARLIPLLDMKPEQQQRVFQALARTSPNFVPGMRVDGTTLQPSTATAKETLLAELSTDQATAYLQDIDARSAWWEEYLAKVASNLTSDIPVPGAAITTPDATTTTPLEVSPTGEILPAKESQAPSGEE